MRIRPVVLIIVVLLAVPCAVPEVGAQDLVRKVTLEEALGLAERNNPNLEQSASSVHWPQVCARKLARKSCLLNG